VSPAHTCYNETMSTLRYASNAKNIVNKPQVNEVRPSLEVTVSIDFFLLLHLARLVFKWSEILSSTIMSYPLLIALIDFSP
jgi:hypothetical protein